MSDTDRSQADKDYDRGHDDGQNQGAFEAVGRAVVYAIVDSLGGGLVGLTESDDYWEGCADGSAGKPNARD